MPGLIAFWNFDHMENDSWNSHYDENTTEQSFPIFLKQIGDSIDYTVNDWPYDDNDSKILTDDSGPFEHAIRFNRGHIYGSVPRSLYADTPLNLHGRGAFTMVAWVKFIGERHMVAGIWDEGGWDRYKGRRQVALFTGLFNQKGVIGHVSATGAASYPQSKIDGSQYARIRAIDGQAFENDEWICMAMSYDPQQNLVKAYLNGKMTQYRLTDPVAEDVFKFTEEQISNPLFFDQSIYGPYNFVLKFNGYDLSSAGVSQHLLQVNLNEAYLVYNQDGPGKSKTKFRIDFDIRRSGRSLLDYNLIFEIEGLEQKVLLPNELKVAFGDQIYVSLEEWKNGSWKQVGSQLVKQISEGAPFTIGRALGLASEEIEHGSQLYVDGVAVFNRALRDEELQAIHFVEE